MFYSFPADGDTCLFHELISRNIAPYRTSLQWLWSALSWHSSLLFTQAWIYTLFRRAYNGRQTERGAHTSPAPAVSVAASLLRFVADQRLRILGIVDKCVWVYNRVCEVVFESVCVRVCVGRDRRVCRGRLTFSSFRGA